MVTLFDNSGSKTNTAGKRGLNTTSNLHQCISGASIFPYLFNRGLGCQIARGARNN